MATRLDFSLRCAFAHGTAAMRCHLDGVQPDNPKLTADTYAVFDDARAKWRGKVAFQGVANLFLPLWANPAIADKHVAEAVKHDGVVLGAYCGMNMKDADVSTWFDALFTYARKVCSGHYVFKKTSAVIHIRYGLCLTSTEFVTTVPATRAKADLPVDLHIDETNDVSGGCSLLAAAKSLATARSAGYSQPVVCGHCTSASLLPERDLAEVIAAVRDAVSAFHLSRQARMEPALTNTAYVFNLFFSHHLLFRNGVGILIAGRGHGVHEPAHQHLTARPPWPGSVCWYAAGQCTCREIRRQPTLMHSSRLTDLRPFSADP